MHRLLLGLILCPLSFGVGSLRVQAQERMPLSFGWGSHIVDGLYTHIDLDAGGQLNVVKSIKLSTAPRALAFLPGDNALAVETPQGIQFHALRGVLMGSVDVARVPNPPFYSSAPTIAFSADMAHLLLLRDGILNVWKLTITPNAIEATSLWRQENVSAATFSPNGKQILFCKKQEEGFCLVMVPSEKKDEIWSRDIGATPAIQLVIVPDGNQARVLTCSIPNRFYQLDTIYDRALKQPVEAKVATWNLETAQMLSSFSLSDYFPPSATLSPQGTYVLYQTLEGSVFIEIATETVMRSNIDGLSHVAISDDESTLSSSGALAQISPISKPILGYPQGIVADGGRHKVVPPSALSLDGTYWAVTADSVPFLGRRTLSSPLVLIWKRSN